MIIRFHDIDTKKKLKQIESDQDFVLGKNDKVILKDSWEGGSVFHHYWVHSKEVTISFNTGEVLEVTYNLCTGKI